MYSRRHSLITRCTQYIIHTFICQQKIFLHYNLGNAHHVCVCVFDDKKAISIPKWFAFFSACVIESWIENFFYLLYCAHLLMLSNHELCVLDGYENISILKRARVYILHKLIPILSVCHIKHFSIILKPQIAVYLNFSIYQKCSFMRYKFE